MKLSISHIAWPDREEDQFLKLVKEWGCDALEIAPNRIWPEPIAATVAERQAFKSKVAAQGFALCSMHALLYRRDDLGLFRDQATESKTQEYLKGLCQLAADLGVEVLVFGSPPNRRRGEIPLAEAMERAAAFFAPVADFARDSGVCFCIEPLQPQETDFIQTAAQGYQLAEMIDSPGFGLHLDAKSVNAEKQPFTKIFPLVKDRFRHFHVNDKDLLEVNTTGVVDHPGLAKALREVGYDRYVSIEMRTTEQYRQSVKNSIEFVNRVYLNYAPLSNP